MARAKFLNHDVRFVDSVAVNKTWIDCFSDQTQKTKISNSLSQWRIDFPILSSKYNLNESHRRILSIVEKILTRGKPTLLQPKLENCIESLFPEADLSLQFLSVSNLLNWNDAKCKYSHPWLDSEEEKTFYDELLPSFFSESFYQFVVPQVEISSLLKTGQQTSEVVSQRVDFLISFPWNDERIIVEIDGSQHQQHLEADQKRDSILREAGYTIIRIPAQEIQTKDGPNLTILTEKLIVAQIARANSSSDKSYSLESAFRIAHQIQTLILLNLQLGFLNPEKPGTWQIISDINKLSFFDNNIAKTILQQSVNCFVELYRRLCRIYSVEIQPGHASTSFLRRNNSQTNEDSVFILFLGDTSANITGFHVQMRISVK